MKFYFVLISLILPTYCIASSDVQLSPDQSGLSTQIKPAPMPANALKENRDTFSASLSLGLLGMGKADEMVWLGDRKLSHLNWQLKTTPIVQAGMIWQLGPRLQLGASGWHNLREGSSFMEDLDWTNPQQPQQITHSSIHPDTSLKTASLIDLGVGIGLIPAYEPFQFNLLFGVQQQQMKWQAKGGSYKYPNAQGNFEKNIPVIDYQQSLITPYVGLYTHYEFQRLRLGATLKYSAWVKGQEEDIHHLRGLKFESATEDSQFYSLGFKASYLTQKNIDFFAAADWTHFDTAQTPAIQTIDQVSGKNGLANQYGTLTLGAEYHF